MANERERLGAALADRYQLDRELGRGGMATVYLAYDRKHDRRVALKVLHPELAHALGPERFLREIRLTAQLDHPLILPLLDSGDAAGFLYYVMPYVEGESLGARLNREPQLPLDDALLIAREVADALSYAHSHGVVHRDIKPENILLAGGHARVADFGIARAVSAAGGEPLTETGLAIGTPAYMSPEQAGGQKDVDGRSDVYALGCVLYEMLAGHPPFTGGTAHEILARHAMDPVPSLAAARPTVSEGLERAVATALAKLPVDRFSTAAQFAKALEPAAALPSVVPSPRRVRALALFGVAAVVVVGSGLLVLRSGRKAPTPAGPAYERTAIAVLYLDNLSRDTADAYLAEGLTEAIIVRLSRVERLGVKSRNAVQRFRDRSADDPTQLGRALGVAYLVNRTVRRTGARVRVTVNLVRASSGLQLWGEQYDREDTDILAVEENVARAVATAIAGRLVPAERATLAARPTRDPRAYDHFLRGNYALARRNPRSVARAIAEYDTAVRFDQGFAPALARIAYAHALYLDWSWEYPGVPEESLLARGFAAAEQALRQDSTLSDAWMALGYLRIFRHPRTFQGAKAAFERAIALDPRNVEAYHQFGSILRWLGEQSAAAAALERARALDPERAITLYDTGALLLHERRFAEAQRWFDSVLVLDPGAYYAYLERALARLRLGDSAGARLDAEAWLRLTPPAERIQGEAALALVDATTGDTAAARARGERLFSEIAPLKRLRPYDGYLLAAALVAMGESERGLDVLERLEPRGAKLATFLGAPEFDRVRSEPRFQRLLQESRPR